MVFFDERYHFKKNSHSSHKNYNYNYNILSPVVPQKMAKETGFVHCKAKTCCLALASFEIIAKFLGGFVTSKAWV